MKKIKFNLAFIFILLLLNSCQLGSEKETSKDQEVANSIYYTCSMDPQIKEDKPGNCPICHMTLTLMHEDKTASNEIALSEQQIELGNIQTQLIEESTHTRKEKFTGVLSINQNNINTLATRSEGRIEKLYYKTPGDYLPKNSPLYDLYSENLAIAKQDYLSAYHLQNSKEKSSQNAPQFLAIAKEKLLLYGLSEKQLKQIVDKNDKSPNTTFYSTYGGYITELLIAEGSYLKEGMPILKLAEFNSLWLETEVNVNYINSIQRGQSTKIDFVDFPSKTFYGKVSFINPELNSNSRLLLIRIEVPNKHLDLKPGMQGIIELTQSHLKGIFLPVDALIRDENFTSIWIEKEEGLYSNRMVTTGIETNGFIEIKSGIKKGDKVVVSGAYGINSEYRFRKGSNSMVGHDMGGM